MLEAQSPVECKAQVTGEVAVERWGHGAVQHVRDSVAEEVPVALVYHGVPHVVMLATPADLHDLAIGFTLSEQLVARADEILSVEVVAGAGSAASHDSQTSGSQEVRIGIAAERFAELLRRRRNLTGRTGCGLCGAEKLEDAIRPVAAVPAGLRISVAEMHTALQDLRGRQQINLLTGSVHAAAWVIPGRGVQIVREDVGRHNALDKVIGAVVRAKADFAADFAAGYFLVTSRASYEMVQKAAVAGAACLVAVSAPTAFAVRLAAAAQLTLVGFAREGQHVVYTHSSRLCA